MRTEEEGKKGKMDGREDYILGRREVYIVTIRIV